MYFDAEKVVNLCAAHKLSIEQFLLCYLVHKNELPSLYKYHNEVKPFNLKNRADLEARGFLKDKDPNGGKFADHYKILPKFYESFRLYTGDYAERIWEAYPTEVIMSDGRRVPGRTMSLEECEMEYMKLYHKGRFTNHEEIFTVLKLHISNGTLFMGLKKWLTTEQWKRKVEENVDTGFDA